MALYPKVRNIHLYVGLFLLLPLLVISGTGVMLNHEHSLGLKPSWERKDKVADGAQKGRRESPDSASNAELSASPEAWRSHTEAVDQAVAAATARWGRAANLERIELKAEDGYGMLVKVKALKSEKLTPEEVVWSIREGAVVERAGEEGKHWGKVVHDLHTGKFFSDAWGYWWSDTTGVVIVLLSLTGVVLYAIPLLKKAGKKKKAAATKPVGAGNTAGPRPVPSRMKEAQASTPLPEEAGVC